MNLSESPITGCDQLFIIVIYRKSTKICAIQYSSLLVDIHVLTAFVTLDS